jgi:hypothetical protein
MRTTTILLVVDEVSRLLELQSGVISRRQLLAHGVERPALERALRHRELTRVLPGVFVDHTGRPTWLQRAWAGVLHWWPAALADESALRAVAGPGWRRYGDDQPIVVGVDLARTVVAVDGFRPVRMTRLDHVVLWNASPPRIRPEVAGIRVAAAAKGEMSTIGILADLCQSRRTTPTRLLAALQNQNRVRGRAWLGNLLTDLASGTCSLLEQGYLARIERPHGLPRGHRQEGAITTQGTVLRDVAYPRHDLYVELDGRLFHDSAEQRDRDLDRDLEAAVDGRQTVRLGWGQVFKRPCWTTSRLVALLRQRGWTDSPTRCGLECEL